MKFKFNLKNKKSSYVIEISCANCKTAIFIYQKRGPGGLLKIHLDRIIESEIDISNPKTSFLCPNCGFPLANKKTMDSKILYRVIRGHINIKKLKSYRY